jgi:hypothetical protein
VRLGLLVFAVLLLLAGPAVPDGDRFHGVVIDAETRAPLVDAVVVAVWLRRPIIRMDGPVYFHDVKETMTNVRGEFSLDASRRIDWNPFTSVASPKVVVRAAGYLEFPLGYEELGRIAPRAWWAMNEAVLRREPAIIELPRLRSREEARAFAGRSGYLSHAPVDDIPRYMRLVNNTRGELGLHPY